MKLAFEASYLSADAVARSIEQIVTLRQSPSESVTSYVNRHRDSFNNLNRQVEKQHVPPLEALQTGVFERGLLPDLFKLQRIGQYRKSMQEAVDRAQRSAASMEAVDGTVGAMPSSTVARGRPRTQMSAVRTSESRRERKRSRSGSCRNQGAAAAFQSSKLPVPKSTSKFTSETRDHSPCSVARCTVRDRSGHESKQCFDHPIYGEANLARYREKRRMNTRRQKST